MVRASHAVVTTRDPHIVIRRRPPTPDWRVLNAVVVFERLAVAPEWESSRRRPMSQSVMPVAPRPRATGMVSNQPNVPSASVTTVTNESANSFHHERFHSTPACDQSWRPTRDARTIGTKASRLRGMPARKRDSVMSRMPARSDSPLATG